MNEQEQVTQGYIPRFGHTTKVPYFLVEEPTKSRVTLSNPNPPSRGPPKNLKCKKAQPRTREREEKIFAGCSLKISHKLHSRELKNQAQGVKVVGWNECSS